jgi:soluble lytic murein transglycosylase-like protein
MSAETMPTARLSDAVGMQPASRSLHLHFPLLIGALALAGALGQVNAAPLSPAQLDAAACSEVAMNAASSSEVSAVEQIRSMRLVEDAQWLVSSNPTAQAPQDLSKALHQASFADRLRDDPVQSAPVQSAPLPESAALKPSAPVKLTKDQRVIARHITRSYRLASESVEQFVHHAFKAAREYRLDPHLVLAVMAVESGFNPDAESGAGAQGLMQVHTKVHTSKFAPFGGVEAAYDPAANIKVGTRILSEYVNRYGDIAAGLKAYVGAASLASDGGYGNKVLNRRNEFEAVVRPVVAPPVEVASESESATAAAVEVAGSAASSPGSSAGL